MGRQIKFRGKRKDNGEWVYGNLVGATYSDYIVPFFSDSNTCGLQGCECFEVINESVGQLTGLKDKSGKEVYEGDILTFEPYEWNRGSGNTKDQWEFPKWVVDWNSEEGCWNLGGGTSRETPIYKEVIGNIYENKNLLRDGE